MKDNVFKELEPHMKLPTSMKDKVLGKIEHAKQLNKIWNFIVSKRVKKKPVK
jgi:hypothetical protein